MVPCCLFDSEFPREIFSFVSYFLYVPTNVGKGDETLVTKKNRVRSYQLQVGFEAVQKMSAAGCKRNDCFSSRIFASYDQKFNA